MADVRAAGVPATLRVEGDVPRGQPGVELSAYRIVQEALTNVIKHAGSPSRVDVIVRHQPGSIALEVVDDGDGRDPAPSNGDGHGVVGMRERVGLWGGELRCPPVRAPRPAGYRVRRRCCAGARDATGMTIRVVVADDQALVRSGFTMLLSGEADIEVVAEAGNGLEAVTAARRELPDVVLMDVRMPVMDGLEATRRITGDASLGGTRVVILTTFDLDEYVYDGLRAGASGFLLKDTLPADLLNAVRVVAAGDALIAPRITRRLIEEFARRPDPTAGRRRGRWTCSPTASARCSSWWRAGVRTPRSPPSSTSVTRR